LQKPFSIDILLGRKWVFMIAITAIIMAAAAQVGVPGELLLAICKQESALTNVVVPMDGFSSSFGICQLKESTVRHLGFRGEASGPLVFTKKKGFRGDLEPYGKPHGLMNPRVNAHYAALILKQNLERYNGDWMMATASYNSGTYRPTKIKKYLGCPRNLKYILLVKRKLPDDMKVMLNCGPEKMN
jgi:soluble lytic murein transglycosylase-like protein